MQSWRIDLCWDGAAYCGWQRQKNGSSIQEMVEKALCQLFGGEKITTLAAGRTDAGVHAMQQIVSFEAQTDRSEYKVYRALNALLPNDIGCLRAKKMPAGFRARNASKKKMYRYRVLNREIHDPLRRGRVWWIRDSITVNRIQDEISSFVGEHDFGTFRASGCTANGSTRLIDSFTCSVNDDEIIFEVVGKGFLRHQVRIMVGTLIDIGRGVLTNTSIRSLLLQKDRTRAGMTAPAHGLYLVWTSLQTDENA